MNIFYRGMSLTRSIHEFFYTDYAQTHFRDTILLLLIILNSPPDPLSYK